MTLRNRVTKAIVRVLLGGWYKGPVEKQQALQQKMGKMGRLLKLPRDLACHDVSADGVPAQWISAPGAGAGVILYLHGGAFALGSIDSHRDLAARMAKASNMSALIINYRLAPKHPYPAALQDTIASYDWLRAQGVESRQIALAGDSAGGGLALSALVALREQQKPLPAGAVCISPWLDLTLSGASMSDNAACEVLLSAAALEKYAGYYAGDHDRTSPLISPLFADFAGLPPLLIQVGTDEVLLDDARRCEARARQAGVDVTLQVWDEMFHVFQMLSFLPESKEALRSISQFVQGLAPQTGMSKSAVPVLAEHQSD